MRNFKLVATTSALLAAGAIASSAFAATITASMETGAPGGSAVVTFSYADEASGYQALQFDVEYDATSLTAAPLAGDCVSGVIGTHNGSACSVVDVGGDGIGVGTDALRILIFAIVAMPPVVADGVIGTTSFDISAGAVGGTIFPLAVTNPDDPATLVDGSIQVDGAGATFAPNPVAFGTVLTGAAATQILVSLTNTGNMPLDMTGGTIAASGGDFVATDVDCDGATLAAAASCTFNVDVTPGAAGMQNQTVGITTVTLGAISVPATVIAIDNDPIYSDDGPIDFGVGIVDGVGIVNTDLTITNAAMAPVTTPLNVSACSFAGGSDPEIAFNGGVVAVGPIAVGMSDILTFDCDTTMAATYNATVNCTSDDPADPNPSFTVQCVVGPSAAPNYTSVPVPNTPLAFGNVSVGATSTALGVDIGNSGDLAMNVTGISPAPAGYTYTFGGAFMVAAMTVPDGTDDVSVTCDPAAAGANNQTLTVMTDAGNFDYPLTCNGTTDAIFNPTVMNGGNLDFGTGASPLTFDLTLTNDSNNADITNLVCGFMGADAASCSITNVPGNTIGQMSSVVLNLSCNVNEGQTLDATLDCTFDGDSTIAAAQWIVVASGFLPPALNIPTLSKWGVAAFIGLLMLIGGTVVRRRMQ